MRITVIMAVLLLSGCSSLQVQDDWDGTDTALLAWYGVALATDSYTTTRIQYHPDLREGNPVVRGLIGENPSTSDTWQLSGTFFISNWLLARTMPKKMRRFYLGAFATGHTAFTFSNCDLLRERDDPCL